MASPRLEKTSTPGIFKRGGRYVVVYRDPAGKQRKQFARTLAEARDVKATLRADVTRGEFRALSRVTLNEYADRWIDTYGGRTRRGIGDNTRDDYRGALEREILPALGRRRLTEIEPTDIRELARSLAGRGLAPASVTKTIAPLKALLATAVEDRLLRANPAAGVRLAQPKPDTPDDGAERVKALSEDDLERLLAELPPGWRFFFEFLGESGLRIGEASELRWRDVEGDWLRVDRRYYRGKVGLPKGRKRRRVPLSTGTARAVWARRKETRGAPDDLVFTSDRGQRISSSNLMSRVLKPAAVQAGLGEWVGTPRRAESWVGCHTFRHTAATRLFRRGWNAKQVAAFLGHADAGFTLRTYVHLLDEDLPRPDFGPVVGNAGATRRTETTREEAPAAVAISGA